MLLFEYKNWMTAKIARTGSTPAAKCREVCTTCPKMTQKSWIPPENRTLPNFKPSKWEEHACLPKCPPGSMAFSCLYFYPRWIIYLWFRQNQSYKPDFGFLAPHSESALFSRNGPTMFRDHLRSNFGHFRDHSRRQDHLRSWDHFRWVQTLATHVYTFDLTIQFNPVQFTHTILQCYKKYKGIQRMVQQKRRRKLGKTLWESVSRVPESLNASPVKIPQCLKRNTENGTIKKKKEIRQDPMGISQPSPRKSERQACQDTPVPNRQHRDENKDPITANTQRDPQRPRPPSAHQPQPWPKAKAPQTQGTKEPAEMHHVKSPYPRPVATTPAHTRQPRNQRITDAHKKR